MSDLVYELSLVFLLAAAIGWFLGRYLCKSGEYAERAEKQQLAKQIDTLQAGLLGRDKDLQQARSTLNEHERITAELEQQKAGQQAQIGSLNQERDKLLVKLQELETCHARIAILNDELTQHRLQFTELKTIKAAQAEQIEALQQMMFNANDQVAEAKRKGLSQQELIEKTQAESLQQRHSIQELEQDKQQLYLTRIHLDEAKSRLNIQEEEKKALYERLTALNHEHQQLRQQCQSLRGDSLQFTERFSIMMKEKDLLSQEVERLNIEKHDYLGRLRAISSVVDMIGTEHQNGN